MVDDRESYIEMLNYENGRKRFIEDLYDSVKDRKKFFNMLNMICDEAPAVINQREMTAAWDTMAEAIFAYDEICNKNPSAMRNKVVTGKSIDVFVQPHSSNAAGPKVHIVEEDSTNSILDTFSDSLKILNDFVKDL